MENLNNTTTTSMEIEMRIEGRNTELEDTLDGFSFANKMSTMFMDLSKVARDFCKENATVHLGATFDRFFTKLENLEKEWNNFGVKFDKLQAEKDKLSATLLKEKKKSNNYFSKLLKRDNNVNKEKDTNNVVSAKLIACKTTQTIEIANNNKEQISVPYLCLQDAKDTLGNIKRMVQAREDKAEFNRKKMSNLERTVEDLKEKNQGLAKCLKEYMGDDAGNVQRDLDKYMFKDKVIVKVPKVPKLKKPTIKSRHSSSTTISEQWSNVSSRSRCESENTRGLSVTNGSGSVTTGPTCHSAVEVVPIISDDASEKHLADLKSLHDQLHHFNKQRQARRHRKTKSKELRPKSALKD